MIPVRCLLSVLAACACFAWCSLTLAEPATEAARAEADRHTVQGLQWMRDGKKNEGLEELLLAHRTFPQATTRCNLGYAYLVLEQPVLAVEWLSACLDAPEGLTPDQVEDAKQYLGKQKKLIGVLIVTANTKDILVKIDDIVVDDASAGKPIRVLKGRHTISVEATDYFPMNRREEIGGNLAETRMHFTLKLLQSRASEAETWRRYGKVAIASGAIVGVAGIAGVVSGLVLRNEHCFGETRFSSPSTTICKDVVPPLLGIGAVAGVLGSASLVTGIVWSRRSDKAHDAMRMQPMVGIGRDAWSVGLSGHF